MDKKAQAFFTAAGCGDSMGYVVHTLAYQNSNCISMEHSSNHASQPIIVPMWNTLHREMNQV